MFAVPSVRVFAFVVFEKSNVVHETVPLQKFNIPLVWVNVELHVRVPDHRENVEKLVKVVHESVPVLLIVKDHPESVKVELHVRDPDDIVEAPTVVVPLILHVVHDAVYVPMKIFPPFDVESAPHVKFQERVSEEDAVWMDIELDPLFQASVVYAPHVLKMTELAVVTAFQVRVFDPVPCKVIALVWVRVIPALVPVRFIDPYTFHVPDPAQVSLLTSAGSGQSIVQSRQFCVPLIVTVYAAFVALEDVSKMTLSADVGAEAPPDPPDDVDQFVVVEASHVPDHPTQYLFAIFDALSNRLVREVFRPLYTRLLVYVEVPSNLERVSGNHVDRGEYLASKHCSGRSCVEHSRFRNRERSGKSECLHESGCIIRHVRGSSGSRSGCTFSTSGYDFRYEGSVGCRCCRCSDTDGDIRERCLSTISIDPRSHSRHSGVGDEVRYV